MILLSPISPRSMTGGNRHRTWRESPLLVYPNRIPPVIDGGLKRHVRAFTLLEVILAIAILGVSLAIIGEGFRMGLRNIDEARHEVRASLIAESVLSQVAAGALTPENSGEMPYEFDGNWLYSIMSDSVPGVDGLLVVSVSVHHVSNIRYSVTMTRWLTDPNWLAEQAANNPLNQAAAAATTSGTSTTGSTSSSGSGSSSGSSSSGGSR